MLLGYELNGSDAKLPMLGDGLELAPPNPCNPYKSIYEINFLPDSFKIPKRRNDFYDSLDGFFLVSERVLDFCKKNNYRNLEFIPLKNTKYFWLKSNNIIRYNKKSKYIRYYNYSKKCKGYEEIVSPGPLFLMNKTPLSDNFHRTDISFGKNGRSPVMCIGIETYKKIKKAGFTGVFVNEIHDKYDEKKLPDMKLFDKMNESDFSFLDLIKD